MTFSPVALILHDRKKVTTTTITQDRSSAKSPTRNLVVYQCTKHLEIDMHTDRHFEWHTNLNINPLLELNRVFTRVYS